MVKSMLAGMFPSDKRLTHFMDWMSANSSDIPEILKRQFIIGMHNCLPKIKVFHRSFTDQELRSIQVPTKIIVGEYDVQYDSKLAIERAKSLIPDVQTEIIADAGHGASIEKPTYVNESILRFI